MPTLFDVMKDYEYSPDFQHAIQRLESCSAHAQRVIGYLKLEFEWKSGWLNDKRMSRYLKTVQRYRAHFHAMPEPPEVVEEIAWQLLTTLYWQSYYTAHHREFVTREVFHQRYFVTLPLPAVRSTEQDREVAPPKPSKDFGPRTVRSWKALRFQILKRDAYRCRLCGQSPENTPGTLLEVDHITPRSKGGNDDPMNLWVLCLRCNRGKGTQEL